MPSDHPRVRLGELIRIKHGFAFKGEFFTEEPQPYVLVTPGNFAIGGGFQDGKLKFYCGPVPDDYVLKAGDLIVTMTDLSRGADTLGFGAKVPMTDGRIYLHNQRVGLVELLRPKDVSAGWLHYLLRTAEYRAWVIGSATGSTVKHTSPSRICDFEFSLPAIEIQEEVACTLEVLDNRIDLLRQTNVTLEAIAQALFKSWFIDFDPVRAKAEGREPEGMDTATAALLPSEFEESQMGLIPKGWAVEAIGKLAECVGGGTPSTKETTYWVPETHAWATPKDLSGLGSPVLLGTDRKLSDAGLAKVSSGLLPAGTLLMSSRAPIGYLALAQMPVAVNQGFIAMLPGGALPPEYLYFWAQANMDAIKQKANGSTFMEISKTAFRPIPALKPPQELVEQFAAVATALFERITANERQRVSLAETRDTLLPRLITGKLRLLECQEELKEMIA